MVKRVLQVQVGGFFGGRRIATANLGGEPKVSTLGDWAGRIETGSSAGEHVGYFSMGFVGFSKVFLRFF